MSDNESRSLKNKASLVGGVIGGVAGVAVAHASHANKFISDVVDTRSPLHEGYHNSVEYLASRAEDIDEVEALIRKSTGVKNPHQRSIDRARSYAEHYEGVMAEAAKVENSPKYLEELKKFKKSKPFLDVSSAKEALDYISDAPDMIESIHFVEEKGKPVTELLLRAPTTLQVSAEGKLVEVAAEKAVRHKIFGMAPTAELVTYEHAGIRKLNPADIEKLGSSKWFAAAEKNVLAAEEGLASHYKRIFKSAMPSGWAFKNGGKPDIGTVAGAAAIGMVLVGTIAAAVVGNRKHSQRVADEKNAAAAPGIPGL